MAVATTQVLSRVKWATRRRNRAVDEFEQAIVAAVAAGESLRSVAEVAGISHAGVDKLVRRRQSA